MIGDEETLVRILQQNAQFSHPEVEAPAAMERVAACDAAVFLVAVVEGRVRGCVRATYDGSRAMVHLLSVHPDFQNRGLGGALLGAVEKELRARGS